MEETLKKIWAGWMKGMVWFGNIISTIILVIFYYTVFALFALPFRLFSRPFDLKNKDSNFVIKNKNFSRLSDFQKEF